MVSGSVLAWLLGSWFAAVAALIAYRILTGQISLGGVLARGGEPDAPAESRKFSPERAQLLLVTLAGLASYVATALSQQRMPELDSSVLALFALSHAVYLGGKIARR